MWLAFVTFCVLFESTIAVQCGVVPRHKKSFSEKIIGGGEAAEGNWPFLVSIQDEFGHFCTGSVITEHYILSAAHCFGYKPGFKLYNVTIVLGTVFNDDRDHIGLVVNASKIWNHENFTRPTVKNDIALIRLDEPINFDLYPNIVPICLQRYFHEYPGEMGFIAGWGDGYIISNGTGHRFNGPKILHENFIPFKDSKECAENPDLAYPYYEESEICEGGYFRGMDHGDSGGPLMTNWKGVWYEVGVASFMTQNDQPDGDNYPYVYTRVSYYTDWIRKTIINNGDKPPRIYPLFRC